jgi:hypothetical protein
MAVTLAEAGVHAASEGLDSRPTLSRGQAFRGNDMGKLTHLPFPTEMYTPSRRMAT